MSNVAVEEVRFGSLEALRIESAGSGTSAVVALRGATLLSWHAVVGGTRRQLLDGYVDSDELIAQAGVHSGLMAPFSNRVRNGRYSFDGEEHDLLPGVPEPGRVSYHGFLRLVDCDVVGVETADGEVRVRLATQAIRPGAFAGYPFAIDLEVCYVVGERGLTLEVTGHNVGDRPAPYGCGWHPYFRLGDNEVDHLELQVPARTAIRTDASLIPLDGESAYAPIAEDDPSSFRTPRAVGDQVIDGAYTDLVPDADGLARTHLRNPRNGLALTVWQRGGLMHVFTGDTLEREPRSSIALEPVELMTDAFNRPDCRDAVVLAPGAQRDFVCGVEISSS